MKYKYAICIYQIQLQLNKFLGKDILSLEEISRFQTISQIKNWLTNIFNTIIEIKISTNSSIKRDIIDEIKEYIKLDYGENITLANIAKKFYINPYYLSQLFKKKTGNTFINFITKVRIENAKELLSNGNLRIYEVANKIGYTEAKYFSKVFKKHVGCKPSKYRLKQREN